jgi:hypothetical protein
MADQEGAGGDLAPTVGTDKPTNDTHRAHSPNNDGVRAMGLIASGRWGEDCSREPDGGPGSNLFGVMTPCRFCHEAHSWVDCPMPHALCYKPSDCQVPHWHPYRGLFCGAPLVIFNEEGEAVCFTFGGTNP